MKEALLILSGLVRSRRYIPSLRILMKYELL